MSPLNQMGILAFTLLFCSYGSTQNCALSGSIAWSEQLRTVIAGCELKISSPDESVAVEFDRDGRLTLFKAGDVFKALPYQIEAPAMFSWSPKSDEFFVNDGQGSGMSSTFRLFQIHAAQVTENRAAESQAASIYRKRKRCAPSAADPNVWGLGWSEDSSTIYLLVQTTVNEPCGEPGSFMSMNVSASSGEVERVFSETETMNRFAALLPPELRKRK